jgi:hypothetical protein
MADFPELRKQIAAAETEATTVSARLRQERLALAAELREGRLSNRPPTIASLEKRLAVTQSAAEKATKTLEAQRQAAIAAVPLDNALGALDASVPIVFFPVRLETRFRANRELLVRVFPDDVHIDTHEPELTADEVVRGQRYWTEIWTSPEQDQAAWARLADFCGPARAAWVARVLEPADRNTPAPVFPQPPEKESSWTRRPYAVALPDRWIALGYSTERRVFLAAGAPIPDRVAVGPTPDNDGPARQGDASQLIDDEMRWLVDFDAAVANGMALRITLPAGVTSLARLIVVGVKGTMDPAESAQALAGLFDGHHYTRGSSFLPRGTPTNNTVNGPSGYGTRDPGHERSFAAERQGPLFKAGSGAAGDLVARAFGVEPEVFAHSWNADDRDNLNAQDLQTALWPATWGYYLEKRVPGLVADADLVNFRQHSIRYVRGGGPLPALRLRNQPYGLLPVTSLDIWTPADANDLSGRAVSALLSLNDAFARAIGAVPRMASDPDQDLVAVLRMNATSTSYVVRHMIGPLHLSNLYAMAGTPLNAQWWAHQATAAKVNVNVAGLPANTPQQRSTYAPGTQNVSKPLVSDGAMQSYLATLAAADVATLRANTTLPAGQRPLLYDLARHGLLLAFAGAAYRIQLRAGLVTAAERLEPELIDIDPAKLTNTIWKQFDRSVPATTGARSLRDYLSDPANETNTDVGDLRETRQSLRQLSTVPTERLDLLLRESLDTASHRFDAWVTSLATRRLDLIRTRRPTDAFIGGYGWLEDLAPAAAPRSDGYIQTPSPAHATAAAILASGYLAHRADSGPNPFAIDLSSDRIRLAARLIEGARTGQPIGALLGYQLERELNEQNLSRFIARFRRLAPLVSTPTTGTDVSEAIAANNVVHGLQMLTLWKNRDPRFEALRSSANPGEFQKIDALFGKLADQVDALADLILSDNVYEVAQGNFDRASLTLSSVLAGQSIPDPGILRTPRTGTTHNHRVLSFIDPGTPQVAGWAVTPRALAEPYANAWAAAVLGDPANIRCRVRLADGTVREVRLAELHVSALDATYGFEQRMRHRFDPLALDFSRDPQWEPEIASFDDLLAMADALRAAFAKARPLTASDLGLADQRLPASIDVAELAARADAAVAALKAASTADAWLAFGISSMREAEDRLQKVAAVADEGDALEVQTARLRAVFGADFPVLPRFQASNAAEVAVAFTQSDVLQRNRRLEVVTWFTRAARVREGLGCLADVLRFADVWGRNIAGFTVGQMPFAPGESWVALPGAGADGSRLSLVCCGRLPVDVSQPLAGFVWDEWTEVVPNPSETTGMAFHYDRPNSRPPQAILIAVAPILTQPWNLLFIEQILRETLALSKKRLVDQDAMLELDQFLPALCFPINAAGDTIATDLRAR